jgi:hypothetical protein
VVLPLVDAGDQSKHVLTDDELCILLCVKLGHREPIHYDWKKKLSQKQLWLTPKSWMKVDPKCASSIFDSSEEVSASTGPQKLTVAAQRYLLGESSDLNSKEQVKLQSLIFDVIHLCPHNKEFAELHDSIWPAIVVTACSLVWKVCLLVFGLIWHAFRWFSGFDVILLVVVLIFGGNIGRDDYGIVTVAILHSIMGLLRTTSLYFLIVDDHDVAAIICVAWIGVMTCMAWVSSSWQNWLSIYGGVTPWIYQLDQTSDPVDTIPLFTARFVSKSSIGSEFIGNGLFENSEAEGLLFSLQIDGILACFILSLIGTEHIGAVWKYFAPIALFSIQKLGGEYAHRQWARTIDSILQGDGLPLRCLNYPEWSDLFLYPFISKYGGKLLCVALGVLGADYWAAVSAILLLGPHLHDYIWWLSAIYTISLYCVMQRGLLKDFDKHGRVQVWMGFPEQLISMGHQSKVGGCVFTGMRNLEIVKYGLKRSGIALNDKGSVTGLALHIALISQTVDDNYLDFSGVVKQWDRAGWFIFGGKPAGL